MNTTYQLCGPYYARATPGGAYYATTTPHRDPGRDLMMHILRDGARVPLDGTTLAAWYPDEDPEMVLERLYRLQKLEFVEALEAPPPPAEARLEALLPPWLAQLSANGRALLADDNGLCYANAGFAHETAEELSALCGDLITLTRRHSRLLHNNLQLASPAWALTSPGGDAELGFHPLLIGEQPFMLVIGGAPRLTSPCLVDLIEALCRRYA